MFYSNSTFNTFHNTLYFILLIIILYCKENFKCFHNALIK